MSDILYKLNIKDTDADMSYAYFYKDKCEYMANNHIITNCDVNYHGKYYIEYSDLRDIAFKKGGFFTDPRITLFFEGSGYISFMSKDIDTLKKIEELIKYYIENKDIIEQEKQNEIDRLEKMKLARKKRISR